MLPAFIIGVSQFVGVAIGGKISTEFVAVFVNFAVLIKLSSNGVLSPIGSIKGIGQNIVRLVLLTPIEGVCDRI